MLRLIGGGEPDRRWLLKHPPHIAHLDVLFETFPDALVIQTHRDPGKAIPSLCSLVMASHDLMEDGRKDQRARLMGPRETGRAARALRDAEPVRAGPRRAGARRAPRRFPCRSAGDGAADLSVRRAGAHARGRGGHGGAYRRRAGTQPWRAPLCGRDFGITEDEIREQFAWYMDKFDLWPDR